MNEWMRHADVRSFVRSFDRRDVTRRPSVGRPNAPPSTARRARRRRRRRRGGGGVTTRRPSPIPRVRCHTNEPTRDRLGSFPRDRARRARVKARAGVHYVVVAVVGFLCMYVARSLVMSRDSTMRGGGPTPEWYAVGAIVSSFEIPATIQCDCPRRRDSSTTRRRRRRWKGWR